MLTHHSGFTGPATISLRRPPNIHCVSCIQYSTKAGLTSLTPECQRLRQRADSFIVLFVMPVHVSAAGLLWAERGKENQRLIKNDAICLRLCRLRLPHSEHKRCCFAGSTVINLPLYYCSDLSLNSTLLLFSPPFPLEGRPCLPYAAASLLSAPTLWVVISPRSSRNHFPPLDLRNPLPHQLASSCLSPP